MWLRNLSLPPISIHALREEGDGLLIAPTRCLCNFYPRPPRGGRHQCILRPARSKQFLSTPSARRATRVADLLEIGLDISIHALREEGDLVAAVGFQCHIISIHALREEGDHGTAAQGQHPQISIHALREEGDW